MKKILFSALAALMTIASLGAQEIRTNYRSGNMTRISTDYEELTCGDDPVWIRVEKVGYKDGSSIYVLYLNFEQKTSTNVPKGVKMAFNLTSGGMVRAEQIGTDSATKRAIVRDGKKVYWNRTKYAVESADMSRILRGVSSIDVVTGWNPDDYVQMSFPKNELSNLLNRHVDAITKASTRTVNLTAELEGRTDNRNNILTRAKPIKAQGAQFAYNVSLAHLYYKSSNKEDFDLTVQVGTSASYHIPIDALVTFTMADGSTIALKQSIDENNILTVFPSVREIRKLCYGVKSIAIEYEGGRILDTFPSDGLSAAINQQYQILMSVSER